MSKKRKTVRLSDLQVQYVKLALRSFNTIRERAKAHFEQSEIERERGAELNTIASEELNKSYDLLSGEIDAELPFDSIVHLSEVDNTLSWDVDEED